MDAIQSTPTGRNSDINNEIGVMHNDLLGIGLRVSSAHLQHLRRCSAKVTWYNRFDLCYTGPRPAAACVPFAVGYEGDS